MHVIVLILSAINAENKDIMEGIVRLQRAFSADKRVILNAIARRHLERENKSGVLHNLLVKSVESCLVTMAEAELTDILSALPDDDGSGSSLQEDTRQTRLVSETRRKRKRNLIDVTQLLMSELVPRKSKKRESLFPSD